MLLAVLCEKLVEKQPTPARLAPEPKRVRPSYPFPDLISSGKLEVSLFAVLYGRMLVFEFSVKGGLRDAGAQADQSLSGAI